MTGDACPVVTEAIRLQKIALGVLEFLNRFRRVRQQPPRIVEPRFDAVFRHEPQILVARTTEIGPEVSDRHSIADAAFVPKSLRDSFCVVAVSRRQGEYLDISIIELGKSVGSLKTDSGSSTE